MNPFKDKKDKLFFLQSLLKKDRAADKKDVPSNLFIKCARCEASFARETMAKNLYVCPDCGYHIKISAMYRINTILDQGSFREQEKNRESLDPLSFPDYAEKLSGLRTKTGMSDAIITGAGRLDGRRVEIAVLDSRFLMGSMGTAVGERLARAIEFATKNRLALIIFSASGGARMQEGIFSLMQMAKTAAAIERHNRAGLLYISCLTNPTTGGVTASFASLGDVIIAEPGALIGFAGPRVIEQTIRQKLPEGFQSAEYLLEHGFVDAIISRGELREKLSLLLRLHER